MYVTDVNGFNEAKFYGIWIFTHYENMPIQIYRKFQLKIFR